MATTLGEVTMNRPEVVCLCGSTRFAVEFAELRAELTLAGKIVLGPEVMVRSTPAYADLHDSSSKAELDELHKRKIDLADRVLVVNVAGYIGDSTRSEIAYAQAIGRTIDYLEPETEAAAIIAAAVVARTDWKVPA